jgi:pathogenesis-related protein 1
MLFRFVVSQSGGSTRPFLPLCFLLAGCALSAGSLQGGPEKSMEKEILAAHNKVRKRAGVPPLTWSDRLASMARDWATSLIKSGKLAHRPDNNVGENLFEVRGAHASPAEVVDTWAAEAKDYDPMKNSCRPGAVCGHYTQLVWRRTKEVGCGVARGGGREVWVCNYDPPGNWAGERPF